MVEIRPATYWDVPYVVAKLRQADVDECHALGVNSIPDALWDGVALSDWAMCAEVRGVPAALFGVRAWRDEKVGRVGVPWMVCTTAVGKHGRAVMRLAPDYIARMLRAYPRLTNRVHARNVRAVLWLRRMGFTMHPEHAHEATGAPFHWFTMGD